MQILDDLYSGMHPVSMGVFGTSLERVYLNESIIRGTLRKNQKTLEKIADEWASPSGGDATYPPAPSRSTIYKWAADGFPSIESGPSKFQLLAFCAQLDADPLVLFDYRRNGYFSKFTKLRVAIQRGLGNLGAFGPLIELYQPDVHWPSDALAKWIWGRNWYFEVFDNQIYHHTNDYASIKMTFSKTGGLPRAAHIAYRRWKTRHTDSMWRYYGTVIAVEDNIELYSEGGAHKRAHRSDENEIEFSTYFGGRQVEFKIASIHQFSSDVSCPARDPSVIGFEW